MPKFKIKIKYIATFIILLFVSVLALSFYLKKEDEKKIPKEEVAALTAMFGFGDVLLDSEQSMIVGESVFEDQAISTRESRAEFRLKDDSVILLGENAEVVFGNQKIEYRKGDFYFRIMSEKIYKIVSGDIEMESKGASFILSGGENDITVTVLEGDAKIYLQGEIYNISFGEKVSLEGEELIVVDIADRDREGAFAEWLRGREMENGHDLSLLDREGVDNVSNSSALEEARPSDSEKNYGVVLKERIDLEAAQGDNGVLLFWSYGGEAREGFMVVRSESIDPSYPESDSRAIPDPDSREYEWRTFDKTNYHYRVCVYGGDNFCSRYSNDVEFSYDLEEKPLYASAVTLELTRPAPQDIRLSWEPEGGSAPRGYVVYMADDKENLGSDNGAVKIEDEDNKTYTWEDLEIDQIYYFRVGILEEDGSIKVFSDIKEVEI